MELLKQLSDNLIKRTDTRYARYMYHQIPWKNRMTALVGPRGVGKTTLLLQYIKQNLKLKDTPICECRIHLFRQSYTL